MLLISNYQRGKKKKEANKSVLLFWPPKDLSALKPVLVTRFLIGNLAAGCAQHPKHSVAALCCVPIKHRGFPARAGFQYHYHWKNGKKGLCGFGSAAVTPRLHQDISLSSGPKSSWSNPATFMLLNFLTFFNTNSWLHQLLDPGRGSCGSTAAGRGHRHVGDTKSLCPGLSPCAPVTRLLTLSSASRSTAWES